MHHFVLFLDEKTSESKEETNPNVQTSRHHRLQNIWIAVKRLSTKPSSTNRPAPDEKGECNVERQQKFWSPFTKRRNYSEKCHYSSQPNINHNIEARRQSSIFDHNTSKWRHTSRNMIGSPMKKIRKITENMQKCVQRSSSSEYHLDSGENILIQPSGVGDAFDILDCEPIDAKSQDKHRFDYLPSLHDDAHFSINNENKQIVRSDSHSNLIDLVSLIFIYLHFLFFFLIYSSFFILFSLSYRVSIFSECDILRFRTKINTKKK